MVKKYCVVLLAVLALSGCGVQETFETIPDIYAGQMEEQPCQQVELSLPEGTSVPTMVGEAQNQLYLCDGYTIAVQTMPAGDLDRTLRQTTGFVSDALTVMQTNQEGIQRYDCVWTAAGEGEDQVCRAAILDDGYYHYTVTLMAGASASGELSQQWQQILDSVRLVSAD